MQSAKQPSQWEGEESKDDQGVTGPAVPGEAVQGVAHRDENIQVGQRPQGGAI